MAWSSQYNAAYTKPLVRQLMAICQRDMRAALDAVGGANVLASIVTWQFAPVAIPQFPAIVIAPMRLAFDRAAVGARKYAVEIQCGVAVAHQDAEVLAELVQDYARALDMVFMTLADGGDGLAQLYSTHTLTHRVLGTITAAALAAGSVKELFVSAHELNEIGRGKKGFEMAATLQVIAEMEEA
jgi:hypothetical protein